MIISSGPVKRIQGEAGVSGGASLVHAVAGFGRDRVRNAPTSPRASQKFCLSSVLTDSVPTLHNTKTL
jgi:hypothetical protein